MREIVNYQYKHFDVELVCEYKQYNVDFVHIDKVWYRSESTSILRLKGFGLIFKAPVVSLVRAIVQFVKGIFDLLRGKDNSHFAEAKHLIQTGYEMTKAAYELLGSSDPEMARIRFGTAERKQQHDHKDLPIYHGHDYIACCMQPVFHDDYISPDYRPGYSRWLFDLVPNKPSHSCFDWPPRRSLYEWCETSRIFRRIRFPLLSSRERVVPA